MSGVKPYFSVIIAIFAFQACGKMSEEEARRMDPHQSRFPRMQVTALGVEGEWESDCNVEFAEYGSYQKIRYSLIGGAVTKTVSVFKDRNCQAHPRWERVYTGGYKVMLDKLDQYFSNLAILPQHQDEVTLMNLGDLTDDHLCKSQIPFEVGKQVNFSPITQCSEETEQVANLDLRGSDGLGNELFIDHVRFVRVR